MKALLLLLFMYSTVAKAQIIKTIAGTGVAGYSGDGGTATAAELNWPTTIVFDHDGNMYIPDGKNNVIRKITSAGIITSVAGNGYGAGIIGVGGYTGDGGPASAAELNGPANVAFDAAGNMYIADQGSVVRKINTSGIITTIAGNGTAGYNGDGIQATAAELYGPLGLVFDHAGNLYIGDEGNHRIRKINTAGIITTVVGTGAGGYNGDGIPASAAQLDLPCWITFSPTGDLYIPERANHRVRKVDGAGIITTVAGNGMIGDDGDGLPATAAKIYAPEAVTFDASGNYYISNGVSCTIRKVNSSGIITKVAGNDTCGYRGDGSPATDAEMNIEAVCTAIDAFGNLYIADLDNSRIRKVFITHEAVNNVAITQNIISIFPNPASDEITIKASDKIENVIITNAIGQIVFKQSYGNAEKANVGVSAFPAGVYFVKINAVYVQKFVKE